MQLSAQVIGLFRGTVGRGRFAAIGSALIALKYVVEPTRRGGSRSPSRSSHRR